MRSTNAGPILAPRDLEAGGSWLGLNAHGVFVGLTNLRVEAEEESRSGMQSRGDVVMAALEATSAIQAERRMAALPEGAFNPFQLYVADGTNARLIIYRDRPRGIALEAGIHIVGNVEADRTQELSDEEERIRVYKMTRIRERVEKVMTEPREDLMEGLSEVCREHVEDESPFASTCVHVLDRYGTRSSLLLDLSDEPGTRRLWASDGPPCRQPFEDLSPLLRELDAMSGKRSAAGRE